MPANERMSAWAIFAIFTRLGLTSFGGPVAHIAYFKTEFVDRRRWFANAEYADIVALCQLMPGPASSQVGLAIGLLKGGYRGMLAAWCGFTWPSALLMTAFGLGLVGLGGLGDDPGGAGWLHGLMIVVVAVVAQAVLTMARGICTTPAHGVIALAAAAVAVLAPGTLTQIAAISVGAVLGSVLMSGKPGSTAETVTTSAVPIAPGVARAALFMFFLILAGLPLLRMGSGDPTIALADTVYRAGALVFGGGHVVLPLLETGVVDTGWVAPEHFLAGYGAAQALPGPLFTFAAYLGAVKTSVPTGIAGAAVALIAIFASSFLLVAGLLPFWQQLRSSQRMRAAIDGVGAAVVGILAAALWDPVITKAIAGPVDVILAAVAFTALQFGRMPPWLLVMLGALVGAGSGLLDSF